MRRLLVLTIVAAAALLAGSARAATGDEIVTSCPSATAVSRIDAFLSLSFEHDPTAGVLACHAAAGSADLTPLQERVYQTLIAMRKMPLAAPLPWTPAGLFDWLHGAITGIRFRNDIPLSFCCEPAGVIDVSTMSPGWLSPHWIDPSSGGGVDDLIGVLVHEARHNESGGHTCGTNDATLAENGAWAIEYYTRLWEGLYGGAFLDLPPSVPLSYPAYERDQALGNAEWLLGTRFCSIPQADLWLAVSATPTSVATGDLLTYVLTAVNGGPGDSPRTWVTLTIPAGTSYVAASPGCVDVTDAQVTCDLGYLAAGFGSPAKIVLRVTAPPGTILTTRQERFAQGMHVTGEVADPTPSNNSIDLPVGVHS